MKVIVADDSMVMRKIISKVVVELGYDPMHAANGKEVFDILDEKVDEVGLVLLDWHMPLMNGFEVLTSMQKDSRYKQIPILMVTTESEVENIKKVVDTGARNFLSKPFTSEELSFKIQETLGAFSG